MTEEEAEAARTKFFRRLQTDNTWEEADMVPLNSEKVSGQGNPDLPFHAFISDENDEEYWGKIITSYINATGGESFILDAGHYVHLDEPELIAEKSREVIEKAAGN